MKDGASDCAHFSWAVSMIPTVLGAVKSNKLTFQGQRSLTLHALRKGSHIHDIWVTAPMLYDGRWVFGRPSCETWATCMDVGERFCLYSHLMAFSCKRDLQDLAARLQPEQRVSTVIGPHTWRAAGPRPSGIGECESKAELNGVSFILDLVSILISQSLLVDGSLHRLPPFPLSTTNEVALLPLLKS